MKTNSASVDCFNLLLVPLETSRGERGDSLLSVSVLVSYGVCNSRLSEMTESISAKFQRFTATIKVAKFVGGIFEIRFCSKIWALQICENM